VKNFVLYRLFGAELEDCFSSALTAEEGNLGRIGDKAKVEEVTKYREKSLSMKCKPSAIIFLMNCDYKSDVNLKRKNMKTESQIQSFCRIKPCWLGYIPTISGPLPIIIIFLSTFSYTNL